MDDGIVSSIASTELHWGIIGCGDVCERKSGPAFAIHESGSYLRAVCRRSPGKAKLFDAKHSVPAHYTSAVDLFADPRVNAVYVATPPDSHMELALAAAEAGFPTLLE
jgi:1,5-anhydro-D-fructose reductase (1,5-anhydro-D-mannitol-forming)